MGVLVVVSMIPASRAEAQSPWGLRPGAWGGEMELGFAAERQQTRSDGGPRLDLRHRRFRERLGIRNQGFSILDPRLFTGSLGLSFDLFQDLDRSEGAATSRQGTLVGYAFDSTFVAEKPYSASLFANRNQSSLTQPFGGRTEIELENRGAVFRLREDSILRDWGIPYFSATGRAHQERTAESTTGLGQTFRRDELRNVLSVEGRNGFETADLDFRYEFSDLENRALPRLGFQTHAASLNYSLDFGPTLNRRWDSRLSYFARTGLGPMTFFTADEQLRIDHYANLATDYRYLFTNIDTQAGTTSTHNGVFHAQHRLYRNLTTNALLSGIRQELPAGLRNTYAGQLDFSYQRSLPSTGRLFAHAGGRRQLDDNDLEASQVNVTDEPHNAPSPLGGGAGFLLEQPFVVASTIVVVDTRGGARLPTTPGVDYDIVAEGDLTRIVPLPTSLVILPGDPLAVSYTYEVDPSIEYSTASWWLNAGVDLRWVAASFGHEQSDQTQRSGRSSPFLEDRRRDTAQVELRGAWNAFEGRAGAGYLRYDATRLAYTQQRFSQFASYRPWRNLVLALNAEESSTQYTLPVRRSESQSARLTLDWFAPGGWWVTGLAGRRVFKDSSLPTETVNEASLTARLTYGKLDLATGLTVSDRTRGAFRSNDWRLEARVTRRF